MSQLAAAIADEVSYGWLQATRPLGLRPSWQRKNPNVTIYKAGYTPSLFHLDSSPVRGLMGPLGSGKSVAMCLEIMARACTQPIDSTGKRRSAWVVIRNTYRELADSTIQTWLDWFPEEQFGHFHRGDNTHSVRLRLADDSLVELDVVFRALDRPADVRKLLSVEYTAAWVNEAREIPKAVIDMLGERLGRFPSYRDPVFKDAIESYCARTGIERNDMTLEQVVEAGGYWSGIIMDTNPPEEDSWWYKVFEKERPKTWKLFRQPGGRSKNAENLENLKPGYYQDTGGKSPAWIKVYFDGEYGFVLDGKPVYPEFTDSFHVTDWATPLPGVEIRIGLDFGLTPAAVFVQQDIHGRWRVIDELVSEFMGITRFGELLAAKIQTDYRGHTFKIYGDPAGDQRAQTDERTPFMILNALGLLASPARTNDFNLRREAVAQPLMRFIDGKPGLAIHPKCHQLRLGMAGKYAYKRVQVLGDDRYHDKPDKGMYSHVCEALQYVMLEFGSNPTLTRAQQQLGPQSFVAGGGDISPYNSMVPACRLILPDSWPRPSMFAASRPSAPLTRYSVRMCAKRRRTSRPYRRVISTPARSLAAH